MNRRRSPKTFRALMRCEISLNQDEAAITTFKRALDLLQQPLKINPKPLRPLFSDMIKMAIAIDSKNVVSILPPSLQKLSKNYFRFRRNCKTTRLI